MVTIAKYIGIQCDWIVPLDTSSRACLLGHVLLVPMFLGKQLIIIVDNVNASYIGQKIESHFMV